MTYNHTEYMRHYREKQRRECPGCHKRKGPGAFSHRSGIDCQRCATCRSKLNKRNARGKLRRVLARLK